jgi:hypothetical protein
LGFYLKKHYFPAHLFSTTLGPVFFLDHQFDIVYELRFLGVAGVIIHFSFMCPRATDRRTGAVKFILRSLRFYLSRPLRGLKLSTKFLRVRFWAVFTLLTGPGFGEKRAALLTGPRPKLPNREYSYSWGAAPSYGVKAL